MQEIVAERKATHAVKFHDGNCFLTGGKNSRGGERNESKNAFELHVCDEDSGYPRQEQRRRSCHGSATRP
jgi:hypothetical protein